MLRFRLLLLFLAVSWAAHALSPSILYLTWTHDPTTTMTIQWHTGKEETATEVQFRRLGEIAWQSKEGVFKPIRKTDYLVHTTELTLLEPNTDYEFCIQGKKGVYKFRTMPSTLDSPIRFVVGGDAYYHLRLFQMMNAQIAAHEPDFVVVGGDIAYTNGHRGVFKGKNWEIKRWRTFLRAWKEQMVTSDGRLIPLLPVVGNHDVRGSCADPFKNELMFYDIFTFPNENVSFRNIDFGSYLSLFLLDSGHSYPITGQQTSWLDKTLSSHENFSYKMAAYHIGAYPSVYPYRGSTPQLLRQTWCPLFEKYHLNAAFEHHSHAYKRTHPIKQEKIDPDGVLYFGDGSWGVSPRKVRNSKMWYMARSEQENAVCFITLSEHMASIEALAIDGLFFDSAVTQPTPNLVSFNPTRLFR